MCDKTFEIYPEIKSEKVYFNNRFGIKIAGDLYLPVDYENQKKSAIAVSGPFGGVKEQCSGLYAQEFARMGFVAVAFDQSLPVRAAVRSGMWHPLKSSPRISARRWTIWGFCPMWIGRR